MKRIVRIILCVLVFAIVGGVAWYVTPVRFLKDVSAEEIDKVCIFDGNNGCAYTITDREQISTIVNNIKSISFKRVGVSVGRKGYKFKITFEKSGAGVCDDFIVNSNNELRRDPFFYYDESGSVCADYIGNLIVYDFQ